MKKFAAKVREFAKENPGITAYYAFCAGSIVTSTAVIVVNRNVTLLRVTAEHQELLKQGGAVFYDLKDQTVHLVNIAAVEATL